MRRPFRMHLWCAVLLLSACSDARNGSSNDTGSGGGGGGQAALPTSEDVLLPFVTAAGELKAIDPAQPSSAPITIDTGLDPGGFDTYRGLYGGRYNDLTHALEGAYMGAMVYVKSGRVYRVSLVKGASALPVQVTSTEDACDISDVVEDFGNVLHSRVFVATAVNYPDCSLAYTNGTSARLDEGASATRMSAAFAADWQAIRAGDGTIAGWLGRDREAGRLNRYDANLQNPVIVASIDGSVITYWPHSPVDRHTMYVGLATSVLSPYCVHRYEVSTNTLSACLHAFAGEAYTFPELSAADATHQYFADGAKAYRVAHDGSAAALLTDHGPGFRITDLKLSENRLVLVSANYDTGEYRLTTSSKSPLDPQASGIDISGTTWTWLEGVAGPWVYYMQYSGGYETATRARDDATDSSVRQDAQWAGYSVSPTQMNLGRNLHENAFHIELAAGDSFTGEIDISSSDAQTGAALNMLGSPLGNWVGFDGRQNPGVGRFRLSEIRIVRGYSSSDTDVYFMDSLTPGSLRPVAQIIGANDRVVH